MGLTITRLHGENAVRSPAQPNSPTHTSSVWSARDLCPLEWSGAEEPNFVQRVVPDAQGHLGDEQILQLFDRLWALAGVQTEVIAQLDMTDVKTTEPGFVSELEFFRRQLRRNSGFVRVINFESARSAN